MACGMGLGTVLKTLIILTTKTKRVFGMQNLCVRAC